MCPAWSAPIVGTSATDAPPRAQIRHRASQIGQAMDGLHGPMLSIEEAKPRNGAVGLLSLLVALDDVRSHPAVGVPRHSGWNPRGPSSVARGMMSRAVLPRVAGIVSHPRSSGVRGPQSRRADRPGQARRKVLCLGLVLFPERPAMHSSHRRGRDRWVHADRAAGGDRDHRGPDRPAPARRPGGPRGGPAGPVRQQPEADRPRPAQLSRHARARSRRRGLDRADAGGTNLGRRTA